MRRPDPARGGGRVAWWIGALFLAALGVALFVGRLPLPVFLGYVGLSVLAIGMYWRDKSAARRGAWRTPESTLHIVALFGGWPGALIAQALFRHKSSKTTFRVVFWFTVLINVGVLAWLASTDAFAILEAAG